jgi:hypothetical protein
MRLWWWEGKASIQNYGAEPLGKHPFGRLRRK